jgi:small subunit ribosomal protein S20
VLLARLPGSLTGGVASLLSMANIASQEKRIHRAERERLENRRYTSAVKTYFRRLETAVESGDADSAEAEFRALCSRIDCAVRSGALHRNNAARKKARAAALRAKL